MKTKIFFGIMALAMGLSLASCEDEVEYSILTTPVLTESSVVTGTSDVTATTATLNGSVSGLESMASSAYVVGFNYGLTQDNLSESVNASLDNGTFTATVSGLTNNSNLYYQAFVRLQGKVTYTGEVKSLVTTNAKVVTADAASIDYASAVLGGKITDAPADASCGIVISTSQDVEAVRTGLIVANKTLTSDLSIERSGLLPSTTYYYAAYLNLGTGIVYGDVKSFTTAAYDFDLDNDLVDLGLSVKWARFNVGAKSETDKGGLFGFGDLSGCNNSIDPVDYASADTYRSAADIVYAAYQGKATLPTAADYEELFALCTSEWAEVDGVAGYKLTGPNGNSIFLPAAGSRTINDVTGEGTEGYYMTGTINPSNNQFAVSYQFSNGFNTKTTTAVYQALSVRAISTAKNVPFVKELLHTKWYLDNGQSGAQKVFEGPYTQWGVTDSWATISNGQPNIEQQIHWEMGTGNGWIGYTYGKDYGYMEFLEDGTLNVHRIAEDGTVTDEPGTYTIDEVNKTITVDVDMIHGNTWLPNKKGTLKILTLTEYGMQLLLDACDGTYGYSLNYYSERKVEADAMIKVLFNCVDSSWAGQWDYAADNIAPSDLNGRHSFVYKASCPNAMVVTLDFAELLPRYPNAVVVINELICDGESIPFDGNKFFYGDIENNGKYRIELFNIFGKGSADGNVVESPFSNAQNIGNEPAFSFTEQIEVVYTIMTEPAFTPNLITINPSWGGPWDFNQGASFKVYVDDNKKLAIDNPSFDITYTSADHAAGSIMTFIETKDLFTAFPGVTATLDALVLDGKETAFDATKIVNTSADGAGVHHRLELWNCYGETSANGCAFGESVDGTIKELGFSSSMQVKFTFNSLFKAPQW